MKKVSEEAQEAMANLIEWEMMAMVDIDLKQVLRSLSLADLSVIVANINVIPFVERFVCVRFVRLEMEYRLGRILDWNYKRDGVSVDISIQPVKPVEYITLNLTLEEPKS